MIKINGWIENSFVVELDFDSFDDICPEKMSLEESDKIIGDAIIKKYSISPDVIHVRGEIK
jgi:hypothetical protein